MKYIFGPIAALFVLLIVLVVFTRGMVLDVLDKLFPGS